MAKFTESDRQTLLGTLFSWSAWIPIPLFLMSVLVLMFLDIEAVHEPKFLIATLNLVFSTGVSLMIVAVAVRSYLSRASGPVLLLGCGMLTFGTVSAIAGVLVATGGINAAITIYNCGILATAGLHLGSVLWALTPHGGLITRRTSLLLILSFVLTTMGLVALSIAMAQGSLPHFFEQGHGPTAIRQVVLGTSIGIFTLTSTLFGILNLQVQSAFLRWYAMGLALIAIGLLGVYPIRSIGSLLNWVGRCSQYVGGLYLLVGMWRSISERGSWELPLGLLREIQGRYQRLVELLPEAIVVHRDGVYLFANSSAARLLHASSPNEIQEMAVLATVVPEDRAAVSERMRLAAMPGNPTPLREFTMLRLDGTRVLVETTGTSIEFGGRPAALVVIRDITERKRAEAAVRETEQRLMLALRNAPIVLFRQDRDLRYTWIYQPRENFSEDDVLGKTDTDLLPPESAAKLMAEKKKVLDTGDHLHTTVSLRVKGRVASYTLAIEPMRDPSGAIIGITCAAMDVTEQEETRIALRQAKEITERQLVKLNAVLTQMTEGLVLFDPKGNLLDMNHAALAIHGFDSTVDMRRHLNDLTTIFELHNLDGDVLPTDQWPIGLALRGETFRSFEVQVRRLDTGKHWIASYGGTPVYDRDGNQILAIVTLRDITDQHETRKQLRALNESLEQRVKERTIELEKTYVQLLHAEKMSSIGKLSASIAHEFNNPLQGIKIVIQGVKKRADLGQDDAELIDLAIKECNRMRDLIKNLQDFSRPTASRKVSIDIHATLESILVLGKKEYATRKISIQKKYAENLPQIVAVADQVKQVLLNLLNNASDACINGGIITIETDSFENNVVIRVHDTGCGITPANREHIFEPFFTTKAAIKGTGLGLPVSYGIIKAHGGEITVDSEPEKGSIFSIILPIEGGSDVGK
jgi:PAS domain S-box-containing protein